MGGIAIADDIARLVNRPVAYVPRASSFGSTPGPSMIGDRVTRLGTSISPDDAASVAAQGGTGVVNMVARGNDGARYLLELRGVNPFLRSVPMAPSDIVLDPAVQGMAEAIAGAGKVQRFG